MAPISGICNQALDHEGKGTGTAVHVYCNLTRGHDGPHTYTDVKPLNRGARWLTYDVKWTIQQVPERKSG